MIGEGPDGLGFDAHAEVACHEMLRRDNLGVADSAHQSQEWEVWLQDACCTFTGSYVDKQTKPRQFIKDDFLPGVKKSVHF